jgi:hypothetical protein
MSKDDIASLREIVKRLALFSGVLYYDHDRHSDQCIFCVGSSYGEQKHFMHNSDCLYIRAREALGYPIPTTRPQ